MVVDVDQAYQTQNIKLENNPKNVARRESKDNINFHKSKTDIPNDQSGQKK